MGRQSCQCQLREKLHWSDALRACCVALCSASPICRELHQQSGHKALLTTSLRLKLWLMAVGNSTFQAAREDVYRRTSCREVFVEDTHEMPTFP